jgi:hypothetical protein
MTDNSAHAEKRRELKARVAELQKKYDSAVSFFESLIPDGDSDAPEERDAREDDPFNEAQWQAKRAERDLQEGKIELEKAELEDAIEEFRQEGQRLRKEAEEDRDKTNGRLRRRNAGVALTILSTALGLLTVRALPLGVIARLEIAVHWSAVVGALIIVEQAARLLLQQANVWLASRAAKTQSGVEMHRHQFRLYRSQRYFGGALSNLPWILSLLQLGPLAYSGFEYVRAVFDLARASNS